MKRPTWQQEGTEPDYRFSLANERTFLAWIRTALAVIASGLLLHQFAPHTRVPDQLSLSAMALTICGIIIAGSAYHRWKTNEIAMRHTRPLPSGVPMLILSIAVAGLGVWITVLLTRGL